MMQLFLFFLFGLTAAFIGSIPVGPVNLSVVDTRIRNGAMEAAKFSMSASLIEVGQSLVAIYFGAALFERVALHTIFNISVVVLLVGLGIYYLQKKNSSRSPRLKFGSSGLFRGALIGLINPQGIPFYIFLLALFRVDMAAITQAHVMVGFLAGIFLGKGGLLLAYGHFGFFLSNRLVAMVPRLNKFIGSILIFLAFVSFIKDLVL